MLHQLMEENLDSAKLAFTKANSENIIETCEKYLALLNAFRGELHKFRGKNEIDLRQSDSSLFGDVVQKRKEVHAAIMRTVLELNQTTALLNWLTAPSGYETAATFNRLNYQGRGNWVFRGGRVGINNAPEFSPIPVQEAVDIAIRLRCQEFMLPVNTLNKPQTAALKYMRKGN